MDGKSEGKEPARNSDAMGDLLDNEEYGLLDVHVSEAPARLPS
jgi:hypothetical protein